MMRVAVLGAVVAVVVLIGVHFNLIILDEGSLCRSWNSTPANDRIFCFFSERYARARRVFREQAAARGGELTALDIGVDGLTIDVALFRGSSDKLLVHLSGVHGVEGKQPPTPHPSQGKRWVVDGEGVGLRGKEGKDRPGSSCGRQGVNGVRALRSSYRHQRDAFPWSLQATY